MEPILTMVCDWPEMRRNLGKMLKPHGLKLVARRTHKGDRRTDDCLYLSIEADLGKAPTKGPEPVDGVALTKRKPIEGKEYRLVRVIATVPEHMSDLVKFCAEHGAVGVSHDPFTSKAFTCHVPRDVTSHLLAELKRGFPSWFEHAYTSDE